MWMSGELQNAVGLDNNDLEMFGVFCVASDRCLDELNEHIPDISTWINVEIGIQM